MASGKSALDLLTQLKSLIQEQECTISSQAELIKQLEAEVTSLQDTNAELQSKINKLQNGSLENHTEDTNVSLHDSSQNTPAPAPSLHETEEKNEPTESLGSVVRRSSSFQRKQFEEQDVGIRMDAYELSSDLQDKQIEVLRKLYGGSEKSEQAARIIQEAYRRYRMRLNFRKIRKSKTRRLTLENKLHTNEVKEDDECKVEVVELVLEHSFNKNGVNNPPDDTSVVSTQSNGNDTENYQQGDNEEASFNRLYDTVNQNSNDVDEEEEPVTPKAIDISETNDTAQTEQEIVDRILSEIALPGIISGNESVKKRKRKKRHGYETVLLPQNKQEKTVNHEPQEDTTDAAKFDEDREMPLLRRSIAMSSTRSRNSDTPPSSRSLAWTRAGSDLSLTSYDNEVDGESMRSSDTASIASGQSEFSNNVISESYQRRSTLSTRGSWHIDPNNDVMRKRLYRIGLNLFNKKPEKGIEFLVEHSFISRTAPAVATFLLNRKGLSRQMVGEYLGNTQKRFNQDVLDAVCELMDFSGLDIDEALRNFQCQIKVQGEAQKVERLIETFSQRYCTCNPKLAESLKNPDSIFILAFAIIMLNTDLHSPNMKHEKRMSEEDFVKNLRGVDNGDDLNETMLRNTFNRIRVEELKTDDDHVTQVLNVEKNIIGKRPVLAVPHRRLVCYCRLYQVSDPAKPQKIGLHQRAVFLFNDLLLITKLVQKKKNSTTYGYKLSVPLQGMNVLLFETTYYLYGIRLINTMDNKVLVTFNAPNEHDRNKFITDLRESINEVQQMENYRIGVELERAQLSIDARSSLSKESKLLSTSMHNLNDASGVHLGMPALLGNDRPASMYSIPQQGTNKNNNNNKSGNALVRNPKRGSSQDLNHSTQSKTDSSLLGSFFKVGKKSPRSRSPSELVNNSEHKHANNNANPQITLTLSEV